MVSGHRRKRATELAGINKIKAIVKNLTDDEAIILMVDSNQNQREELLPSEKAFAYKLRRISDDLCREYGLSIIENLKSKKIDFDYFYKKCFEKDEYIVFVKEDIDFAIKRAFSFEDIEKIAQVTVYISKLKKEIKMCDEIQNEVFKMIEQIREEDNKEIKIRKKTKNNTDRILLNK